MQVTSWIAPNPSVPMVLEHRDETAGPGEVLVRVVGCGVCHTDLGYYYDGIPTRHPFPLTLGHEVSGTVVYAGQGAEQWVGKDVIVPAVIPCGKCVACASGNGRICPKQIFPGCDVHGGFASHLRVPAHGLCPVPDLRDPAKNPALLDLADLSVIADAVSTPYQAILRSQLKAGDLAVFIGAGGVGGFGVQIAAAMGAAVVALDVNQERLELMATHGAALTLRSDEMDFKALRKAIQNFAAERGIPTWRQRIFETSGTTAGQATAFGLLGHGGNLSIVGYTANKVEVRLSNLMALDATMQGNWGCLPEHYPAILDMVLAGKIAVAPFVERRPMSSVNQTFEDLHAHRISKRAILIPEF